MFSRVLRPVFVLLTFVLLAACGRVGYDESSRPLLNVQLVTGLVPGPEFTFVETTVVERENSGRERVIDQADARARFGIDYVSGHSVAAFRLNGGEYLVRVRVLNERGQFLAEQRALVRLQSDYVLRVHITRDCVGVECPAPAGAADATGCLNGRCVDPRCSEETPEFCPEITFCNEASECRATSSCASMVCEEGVCTPAAIEGSCDDHEWCNPDLGAGCQPFDPDLASTLCGTICEVAGTPCQVGYYDCSAPSGVTCEALFNRVPGASCGTSSFCDLGGNCVACPQGVGCLVGCSVGTIDCASGVASCELLTPVESAPVATPCSDTGFCIDGVDCSTNGACDTSGFCDTSAGGAPGLVITPLLGLTTTESGGAATIMVRLAAIPSANVQVAATTTDGSEGLVTDGGVLLFTPDNWNGVQTITVTGVDDALADGNQSYALQFVTTSSDSGFAGLTISDLPILNIDNESAGITVTPTSGIVTNEDGSSATFTVILSTEPSEDVTIDLTSDTPSEATVSPSSLTFTSLNWNAPQVVTVTGLDDAFADGDQSYVIQTDPSISADSVYNAIDPSDVAGTNVDDETPTIVVTPLSGLVTTEAGATATFTVSLTSHPLTEVILDLSTSDATEGSISPSTLSFTSDNWDAIQTVTLTGVDDFIVDGTQVYDARVEPSAMSDASYRDLPPVLVGATNQDDETAGIEVAPVAGLTTTEAGTTTTFEVVLHSSPASSVFVPISSGDLSEGTVSPAMLTFTSANWNAPQTVTVTGVDDMAADGNQMYTVTTATAISGDGNYSGLNPNDVTVTNIDDDSAGIAVTPVSGLTTTEAGATAAFTVRLNTMPSSSVTIPLATSDFTEGVPSPSSLVFTSGNWATPQTVTATGVDDSIADGTQLYQILTIAASSADGTYNGIDAPNVSLSNTDDDSPGFTISSLSGAGHTTEAMGTTSFTVRLASQPTADVEIPLASSDLTEGTVSPSLLTITAAGWNIAHVVTLTGVDDALVDGNQPYTIQLGTVMSSDPAYSGLNPSDVAVVNFDNDTVGFNLSVTSVSVTEGGGTAEVSVVLAAQPTADVILGLSASDLTEATVSPASLTFTATDWNMPHVATVTGVDDIAADGDQSSIVITAAATSADVRYNGVNPSNVSVTTLDDDIPRLLSATPTGEAGNAATSLAIPPSMSTDGRFVAFASSASNLVPGDTNGTQDAFVRDTIMNTTERVSIGDDESESNGNSSSPVITPDGRFVVFASSATNWVAGANGDAYLYIRDRTLGTTQLVSAVNGSYAVPSANIYGCRGSAVTPDGRYVYFSSGSTNLLGVGPPPPVGAQMYIRDTVTLATTLESVGTGGVYGDSQALAYGGVDFDQVMSDDGRYIIFVTDSSNFMMGDVAGTYDLFYRDRLMNTTSMVNVTPMGARSSMGAGGGAIGMGMTSDGRYVQFTSYAADLVAGDMSTRADVFVRDMMTNTTVLASVTSVGGWGNGHSLRADMCDSGRYVAYESDASNMVPGDTNAVTDVFVRDLVGATTRRVSLTSSGMQLVSGARTPSFTRDCNYIAFGSTSSVLVAGDTNGVHDLFIVPRP